jgi:AraC-like DNA-binding protein
MVESVTEGAVRLPTGVLRPFIHRYVGTRLEGIEPGSHRGLPSAFLTLIISLGAPIDVVDMPNSRQVPGSFGAFVGGLHASPATVSYGTSLSCINIELSPLGSHAVLGVRAGELASLVVGLDDVMGRRGRDLTEQLSCAHNWSERFDILDEVFAHRLADQSELPGQLAGAWRQLVASGGAARIDAVAAEIAWSRRHLAERFRLEFGLTPKVAARVIRFDRARRMLEHPNTVSLAMVAAQCGYHDQAHLSREWLNLAGCPPGAWLAAEQLPNVQDTDGSASQD